MQKTKIEKFYSIPADIIRGLLKTNNFYFCTFFDEFLNELDDKFVEYQSKSMKNDMKLNKV